MKNLTDIIAPDTLKVFETLPDLYLILSPDLYVLTASNAYLAATLTDRQEITGKYIFDAFPDTPNIPHYNSVTKLHASLLKVLATGIPHQMPLQRTDSRLPPQAEDNFEKKYWNVLNTPVLDNGGNILYIISKVSDVSEQVKHQQQINRLTSRKQQASTQADLQQKILHDLLMQAPALIAAVRGPDYIYEFVNPFYQQLFPGRELLGKPLLEAVPEFKGDPIVELLDKTYQTGETITGTEIPFPQDRRGNGKLETGYFNITCLATREPDGRIKGVITFGYDVTGAVQANMALEQLNQELESRVEQRTQKLEKARTKAESEQNRIQQLLMQAPAMITIFKGPEHIFHMVNPPYQQLVGERELLGRSIKEAMPELEGQPIFGLLDRVYQTGEPFYANEMLVQLDHTNSGVLGENYYNFIYQATRDLDGNIDGILVFAYEVTTQVVARQQVEQSRQKVQTLNEELATTNNELTAANKELAEAKHALEQLNSELEQRVVARTNALKLAQEETERQRQILHNIFMDAPSPIVILDGEKLVFRLVNPAYQQIFPGRELMGKALTEALPELMETPIPSILQQVYKTGETFVAQEMPVMLARHQGAPLEEIYWTFTYQARLNQQGAVDGVLVFAHDVTDHVKVRKSIEDSERQLRLITDALPVLIGYLDKEEKYRFANHAYEAWFDQKPEKLLGRPVREVVGDKAYQGVKQYIDRALAGERLDFESRMPYREDFTRYIRTSYVPDIQDGVVTGFYTMVNDITEQVETRQQIEEREREAQALAHKLAATNEALKDANQQILASNEELAKSNQQLSFINADMDNFIYTASHDLRAPISNIEGLIHAMQRSLAEDIKQKPILGKLTSLITHSIERFKKTLNELTQITKIQREGSGEDIAQVDLAEIIREVRLDLAPQIEKADARFTIEMEACEPIRFSSKNARSIIYNLISNAIKYRSPQRQALIRISCEQEEDYVVLLVADNGLGMDLSDENKIFAMFKRLHDHVEGSGVGLYIVKKIIENAGGKIDVDSRVDQGSTFKVYFRQTDSSHSRTEESE
ncbi:sensor protein [Flammeovirgaceae bacterium 311]|nr:sensor protein [Flammeovirgaceae bacterium 311]